MVFYGSITGVDFDPPSVRMMGVKVPASRELVREIAQRFAGRLGMDATLEADPNVSFVAVDKVDWMEDAA